MVYDSLQDATDRLFAGVPWTHPDAHEIVCQALRIPSGLRGIMLAATLAARFGATAGLTADERDEIVYRLAGRQFDHQAG